MGYLIIFGILLILIFIFNIFVFLLKKKLEKFEAKIIKLFDERNYKILFIYTISKRFIGRHNEVFNDFLELKRKDFSENFYEPILENKKIIYKKLHNEISFIFKICDKDKKLYKDKFYNYIKDSIVEKSYEIGNNLHIQEKIRREYSFLAKIARLTIIGIFIY